MLTDLMKADEFQGCQFIWIAMAIDVSEIYCRYEDQHRLSSSECHEMQHRSL